MTDEQVIKKYVVVPFVFSQHISNGKKEIPLIFNVDIPLFQEVINLLKRRNYVLGNLPIDSQCKSFHVYLKTSIWVVQKVIEIKEAIQRQKKKMRSYTKTEKEIERYVVHKQSIKI